MALFATNRPDAELCLRNVCLQWGNLAIFIRKGYMHTEQDEHVDGPYRLCLPDQRTLIIVSNNVRRL